MTLSSVCQGHHDLNVAVKVMTLALKVMILASVCQGHDLDIHVCQGNDLDIQVVVKVMTLTSRS